MRDKAFANRLRRELPGWAGRGWLAPGGQAAILDEAEARAARGLNLIPIALAVIGALTLGAGVILFFAANWAEMPKITKLIVLFGSMWIAYAIAARGLSASAGASRAIAHAMLLLGVILFGANIQLIAQIYHIDAHYPNGVLLWTLGALAIVWLAPSQPVAVAGLALATLWSGMEILDFNIATHWWFLAVWASFLPPILRGGWKWATGAALLALFVWCFMMTLSRDFRDQTLFLLQIYVLLCVALHLAGLAMRGHGRLAPLSTTVARTSLIGALFTAHFFIYVWVFELPLWNYGSFDPESWTRGASASAGQIALVAVFGLAALGLILERYRRVAAARSRRDMAGMALAAMAAVLMIANPFLPGVYGDTVFMYVAINGAVFAALIWMIAHGYRTGERFQVYCAFLAYGGGLIALYFMSFWSLMNRSLFVMGGGAVLVAGVYILERQRRSAAPASTETA